MMSICVATSANHRWELTGQGADVLAGFPDRRGVDDGGHGWAGERGKSDGRSILYVA
jgi:hypothetical protein